MSKPTKMILFVFSFLLLFAPLTWASPTFIWASPDAYTDNRGPNFVGIISGHYFHVGAFVEDPLGVPGNIFSVNAFGTVAGQSDYSCSNTSTILFGQGLYEHVTPYTGQMGQWRLVATNNQNETVEAYTNYLDAYLIPLATNLTATGSSLTPTITWDPVLYDHDYDPNTETVEVDQYRVRVIRMIEGQWSSYFRSFAIYGNDYTVPSGLILPGETVHIRLESRQQDDGMENRSDTFTTYTAPLIVDFNHDGDVDSSDLFDFIVAFASMSPVADIDANGFVDQDDVGLFAKVFGAQYPSITGAWSGTWNNDDADSGSILIDLAQVESIFSGNLTMNDTDCEILTDWPVAGSLSIDGSFQFSSFGTCQGFPVQINFSGNMTGDSLAGQFVSYVSGAWYEEGTFRVSR
jgi:hypothetical protein